MRKVIISIVAMCLLFSSITVSAGEINGDMTYEEGAQRIVITDEMRQKEQQKLSAFRRMRAYESYIALPVTYYRQENGYYCGPATVQQVVFYVDGSYRTQDFYASELGTITPTTEGTGGTDMTRIPSVLNHYIDEEHYTYSEIGTRSEWLEKVRYSLHYDRPAVLDINTNGISEFPYSSSGHFVNVSGYDGSTGKVRITDPNDERGNIWYSITSLYTANNNHFRKAIIW